MVSICSVLLIDVYGCLSADAVATKSQVAVECNKGLCRDGDKPGSMRVPAKIDQICTVDNSEVGMGVSRSASRVCEWCLHNWYSYAVQAGMEWERSWRLPCGRRWFI